MSLSIPKSPYKHITVFFANEAQSSVSCIITSIWQCFGERMMAEPAIPIALSAELWRTRRVPRWGRGRELVPLLITGSTLKAKESVFTSTAATDSVAFSFSDYVGSNPDFSDGTREFINYIRSLLRYIFTYFRANKQCILILPSLHTTLPPTPSWCDASQHPLPVSCLQTIKGKGES